MHTVTQRLCLTRDRSRVVPEGDPEAAYLFATPGTVLPDAEAARLGVAALEGPQQTQHIAGPPESKARRSARSR